MKKGQAVQILGHGRDMNSSVSDIQVFKRSVPSAKAGENVGVLLKNVKPPMIDRYDLVYCIQHLNPYTSVVGTITYASDVHFSFFWAESSLKVFTFNSS